MTRRPRSWLAWESSQKDLGFRVACVYEPEPTAHPQPEIASLMKERLHQHLEQLLNAPPALNPSPPAHETPPVPLASLLSAAALAADPLQTYEGEVAGLFCSACSSHVKAALEQIDGVESVKILAAAKGGLPRLRVTSRRPLTRSPASRP